MQEPYKLESQRPGCLFAGARIGDAPKVQAELSLPVSSPSPPTPCIPWDCLKDYPHPTNSAGTSALQPRPTLSLTGHTDASTTVHTLGHTLGLGPGLTHGLGALGTPRPAFCLFPHLKNGDVSLAPSESHLLSGQQVLWRMVRQVEPGSAGHMTPPELGPPPPHLGREEGGSR